MIRFTLNKRVIRTLTASLIAAGALSAQEQRDGKLRVYVSDSQSWQVSGGFGLHNGDGGGHFAGGASPQTVEVIKTFTERCLSAVVTMDRSKADYVVLFD